MCLCGVNVVKSPHLTTLYSRRLRAINEQANTTTTTRGRSLLFVNKYARKVAPEREVQNRTYTKHKLKFAIFSPLLMRQQQHRVRKEQIFGNFISFKFRRQQRSHFQRPLKKQTYTRAQVHVLLSLSVCAAPRAV